MATKIAIEEREGYLQVRASTGVVDGAFLTCLIDDVASCVRPRPEPYVLVLVEVESPRLKVDIIEALEIWKRASEQGIHRTQIAYVVTGRKISQLAKYMELFAQNRGIRLRFFEDRRSALEWLAPVDDDRLRADRRNLA